MNDEGKRPIKDGSHFPQFPNMKTAKIFQPNPNQKHAVQSASPDSTLNVSLERYSQMEIARVEIEIALEDQLKFAEGIEAIDDVDWSVYIDAYHLNIEAAIVNLSGTLKGDIMYINRYGSYSRKCTIPWQHTCPVTYITTPQLPQQKSKREHVFKDDLGESSIHREVVWQFHYPVACHLEAAKITSSEQLRSSETLTHLEFQIVLHMAVGFTQLQQVNTW
ncbi:hypothetical protein GCM10011391_19230 [Pullulanibacillus camelliae]|uniref:Uncharacterized protein n=1 Tax=Pullulanibacillus camelliae TaxID=1707096 RepID=A0A8J2VSV1_9BACL|nr:hypothetical protein [Pullulanibacillus camelliae]GGE40603.1 hypothetical protein GCM10011391_19230 [Pullulanibacillus camelliae]